MPVRNENIHQSGYWFVEEHIEYAPPRELDEFLAKGDKPVYIDFGSVFNTNQKDKTVKLIIEAIHKCGKRAIISGMGSIENLPEAVIAIDSIPHSWLFPRVSAVCHHGGAGTTAAAFKAGVPSVIIPFSNDQFAWAHRSYDLGVGPKPIYRKDLTADKLAVAIKFAHSNNIVKNSKTLGQNIATENGASDCSQVVVSCLEMYF